MGRKYFSILFRLKRKKAELEQTIKDRNKEISRLFREGHASGNSDIMKEKAVEIAELYRKTEIQPEDEEKKKKERPMRLLISGKKYEGRVAFIDFWKNLMKNVSEVKFTVEDVQLYGKGRWLWEGGEMFYVIGEYTFVTKSGGRTVSNSNGPYAETSRHQKYCSDELDVKTFS